MVSVVLMLLATGATVLAQKPLGSWQNGIATNYGGAQDGMDPYSPSFGTKEGSCGYGVLDKEQYPFWSVAALAHSSPFYMAGPVQGCGQCFQIECVNDGSQFQGRCNSDPSERSVTVMITDSCPECASNQFDIQALTFNKIAPMAIGRIAMRYRRVECAPPANMEVKVDSFSGSGGWIRLMVQETAGPGAIKTVQVKGPNTGWQGMTNIWGAAWELNNCPQTPIDVRLVASDGQEVTAFGAIKSDGVTGVLPTWVQFSFGTVSRTAPSSSSGDSSDGEAMVTAFSGPEDGSDGSSSSDDTVPCITAFSGTNVDPTNCATGKSSSSSSASSSSSSSSSSASTSSATRSSDSPSSKTLSNELSSGRTGGRDSKINAPNSSSRSPPPPSSPASPPPQSPNSASSPASPSPGSKSSGSYVPPAPYLRGNQGSGSCDDQQPPGGWSCSQQKSFGACSKQWMWQWAPERPKGYCANTCGYCS